MIPSLLTSFIVSFLIISATVALIPGIDLERPWRVLLVVASLAALDLAIGWVLFTRIGIATAGLSLLLAFVIRSVVALGVLRITPGLFKPNPGLKLGYVLAAAAFMGGLGTAVEAYIIKVRPHF